MDKVYIISVEYIDGTSSCGEYRYYQTTYLFSTKEKAITASSKIITECCNKLYRYEPFDGMAEAIKSFNEFGCCEMVGRRGESYYIKLTDSEIDAI